MIREILIVSQSVAPILHLVTFEVLAELLVRWLPVVTSPSTTVVFILMHRMTITEPVQCCVAAPASTPGWRRFVEPAGTALAMFTHLSCTFRFPKHSARTVLSFRVLLHFVADVDVMRSSILHFGVIGKCEIPVSLFGVQRRRYSIRSIHWAPAWWMIRIRERLPVCHCHLASRPIRGFPWTQSVG